MALCKALHTRLNSRVLADISQGGVVVSMHLESLPVWAFTNKAKNALPCYVARQFLRERVFESHRCRRFFCRFNDIFWSRNGRDMVY